MKKLIVGLGNPGKKYERTRHNIGFVFADKAISNFQFPISKQIPKLKSQISKGAVNGRSVIIAKPQTFMNESGAAARAICDFYKIKPQDIIIIHDDKDIPLGQYKIQTDRGSAGHNGVKSIIEHLGTQNFTRVRVGIATPEMEKYEDKADFVLAKFSKEEEKILNKVIEEIIKKFLIFDI